jgi:adenylate kinase family enzyme
MIPIPKSRFTTLCLIFAAAVLSVGVTRSQDSPPARPLVILIGPPLSGKTTFMTTIQRRYGLPGVSVEDLITKHASELRKMYRKSIPMAEMRYDPAMSRYLRAHLDKSDLSRGIVLDGFPATRTQTEDLTKMIAQHKLNAITLQLEIPDDMVRERAAKGGRQSDRQQIIDQRIKDYHREFDTLSMYFPNAKIVKINGTESEDKMWNTMQQALDEWGLRPVSKNK